MSEVAQFFGALAQSLKGGIARTRENLIPLAFQFLWEPGRTKVSYGGRGSAKSWSITRVLLVLAYEEPLRILCCREIQGSIKESAYRLLVDQIGLLELSDFYDIQADCIVGKNGTRFFFEGLRYYASKIRSYEAVDIVWIEEAQSVSEMSWEVLLPTIRKPGSRLYISFNPLTKEDPVTKRFVESERPGVIAKKVSYLDNPFFSAESEDERAWLERTDPDSYRHVWLGFPREISDALILKGKFVAEPFEVDPDWAGPYHGCDFGFSKDPSAGVRCYIDDANRVLYISGEYWQLGCDIDKLPEALETAIPGISRHVVHCDSSRPETISYLSRNGISRACAAEKWPGSVDDGVMFLRAFSRIVIDPSCVHTLDEARSYSFKCDRLTGLPLPEVEDKHNHCIDAIRYAVWPLIKNLPANGFFSRAALLENGQPAEKPVACQEVFGVLTTTTRAGTGVGLVVFARSPSDLPSRLHVIDYDIVEIEKALTIEWLASAYALVRQHAIEWRALSDPQEIFVEQDGFGLEAFDLCECRAFETGEMINLSQIRRVAIPTLEQRVQACRARLNGGLVKIARPAFDRVVGFRTSNTSHLMSQILGYKPELKDAPAELVAALCIGVDMWERLARND